jgi:hypothetical protein
MRRGTLGDTRRDDECAVPAFPAAAHGSEPRQALLLLPVCAKSRGRSWSQEPTWGTSSSLSLSQLRKGTPYMKRPPPSSANHA